MKKFIFLSLLLSSQFAYGEANVRHGWGENPDAVVVDAVTVHVYTTTGMDPFTLDYKGSVNDFIFIDYKDEKGLQSPDFLISEVYIQQLGDSMAIVVDDNDGVWKVYRVLPDTNIYYYAAPY